jgi:cation:H+ antiporter
MNDYLALILGVLCAGIGGELFVRGSIGLAQWIRIPPGIVGATVAAFATSAPEFSVGINAALAGKPDISLGDVLGSNVVNIALILGLALMISGIQSSRDSIKRDFPGALIVPGVTGLMALDGTISRIDGAIMIAMFVTWLVMTVLEARKQRDGIESKPTNKPVIFAQNIAGLVLLVTAGNLIVFGAKNIAQEFGISDFIIGATVVAVGTSIPELSTTLTAKLRGHDDIGLGTVLGSNIFNGLLIVGTVAMITPIPVRWGDTLVALTIGILAVVLTFPSKTGWIGRQRGFILLGLYALYLILIITP